MKSDSSDEPTTPYTDVPVIYLTEHDLDDFQKFVKRIFPYAMKVGAVKLIPPPSWHAIKRVKLEKTKKDHLEERDDQLELIPPRQNIPKLDEYKATHNFDKLKLKTPIRQWVQVKTSGAYALALEEQPTMTLSEYEKEAIDYENKHKYKRLKKGKATVAEIERLFWRTMKFEPPLYGADHYGTLFKKGLKWNLNELDTLISKLGYDIPGVTRAYLYFGMWKSMFAWHVEDQNLFSISYNHFGAPKRWYVLPPHQRHQMDTYCSLIYPGDFMRCHQFLQHKNFMLSPKRLMKDGFDVHTVLQRHGEFVMTMPGAYHGGFNYGFNCAEAVNFGIEEWMPLGKEYIKCRCNSDRANVNMDKLEQIVNGEHATTLETNTLSIRRDDDDDDKKHIKRKRDSKTKLVNKRPLKRKKN